jgi:catechol 2,3-dioxygenase-like lactoylglutathione lyase family enzyme
MTTHQMDNFRVLQIDHVELFVPDRHEAAGWYQRILGLEVVPALQTWAADPGGPLMISSDGGSTKLALFEGQPQELRPTAGFHRVAFRVRAEAFIDFLWRLEDLQLKGSGGSPVTLDNVVDHEKAFSTTSAIRTGITWSSRRTNASRYVRHCRRYANKPDDTHHTNLKAQ